MGKQDWAMRRLATQLPLGMNVPRTRGAGARGSSSRVGLATRGSGTRPETLDVTSRVLPSLPLARPAVA